MNARRLESERIAIDPIRPSSAQEHQFYDLAMRMWGTASALTLPTYAAPVSIGTRSIDRRAGFQIWIWVRAPPDHLADGNNVVRLWIKRCPNVDRPEGVGSTFSSEQLGARLQ
jgi:hypothetical protein